MKNTLVGGGTEEGINDKPYLINALRKIGQGPGSGVA